MFDADTLLLKLSLNWVQLALVLLGGLLSTLGAGHALLNKRDPRSAISWITICFILPFFGVLLYYMFGKNRIRTRARRLRDERSEWRAATQAEARVSIRSDFANLARLARASSERPLLGANKVQPLYNGDQAYPAMISAIKGARSYVYLTTYIFGTGKVGREFIDALGAARARGVDVKVLIDGFGEKYSFPWASTLLKRRKIETALFLPPTLLPPNLTINLRNHRKLLLIDGCSGFTGGMNIRTHRKRGHAAGVKDVHFLLQGPVLEQMENSFINDWLFCTKVQLELKYPVNESFAEDMACRVLLEGPNEDIDKLTWVLAGAIHSARHTVRLMTPYFLPSRELEVALKTAALRGVLVNIVLPGKNNMPFMTWASNHILPELLDAGVKVAYSSGAFAHTKLFVVDEYYTQLGSANLDPRSLRLNFELVVEVYDESLGQQMAGHIDREYGQAIPMTVQRLQERWLITRLRDAFFWLFSPYL